MRSMPVLPVMAGETAQSDYNVGQDNVGRPSLARAGEIQIHTLMLCCGCEGNKFYVSVPDTTEMIIIIFTASSFKQL